MIISILATSSLNCWPGPEAKIENWQSLVQVLTMNAELFTSNPEINKLICDLKRDCGDKEFSDVIDKQGNQYVDIVMAGGGVLGIALVGYTFVMEQMSIRFSRIGGTSAGAINAILLASLGSPEERKSEQMISELASLNFREFIDGSEYSKNIIEHFRRHGGPLMGIVNAVRVYPELRQNLGLNPGTKFYNWLSGLLRKAGCATTRDLLARQRQTPEGLKIRTGEDMSFADVENLLAIVAADITTETKVVFPKMTSLYWENPEKVDPALYVRASMSIPLFFDPLLITDIPKDEHAKKNWSKFAGLDLTQEIPGQCYLVDGGILSNFPINLFHVYGRVPHAPTFGVKLGSERRYTTAFNNLRSFAWAIFDSSRHCLDYDFIANNLDYKQLVCGIDTKEVDWLDFDLSNEKKLELFISGAEAADKFLRGFDWDAYKLLRVKLSTL